MEITLNYDNYSSDRTSNSSITSDSSINPSSENTSPWTQPSLSPAWLPQFQSGLVGTLFRQDEGHIHSIATTGDFLFTGSESSDVIVWKNLTDFSVLKSTSGMVKAIVVFGDKIFTGHLDGEIRVWSYLNDDKGSNYNQIGSLPKKRDLLVKSMDPRNYVKVGKGRALWLQHYDAVSCMAVDADHGLLYSGSWDKTVKVWRISNSECLESITAHDDVVNSVVAASELFVYTGSADGTVNVWYRKFVGKRTKHLLMEVLWKGGHAVTAMAVMRRRGDVVYAGFSDGVVRSWRVDSRWSDGVLCGHRKAVLCLVVCRNLVVSGSADNTVCVWRRDGSDVHTVVAILIGHRAPVKCLAVESTAAEEKEEGDRGCIVYSGSLDKSVKMWWVSACN